MTCRAILYARAMGKFNDYFESYIKIPRIRIGDNQAIETLINEEAQLFAKFLRNEQKTRIPRIAIKNEKVISIA